MHFRSYDPADAGRIASWARTAAEALAWCSIDSVPVPSKVVTQWSTAADVEAFVLVDESGNPVGYGELWIDDDEAEVELAHLIVDPAERGHGAGRSLVRSLIEIGGSHHQQVFLRVVPDNLPAIRCYLGAGMERVAAAEETLWNEGQPTSYVWMQAPL